MFIVLKPTAISLEKRQAHIGTCRRVSEVCRPALILRRVVGFTGSYIIGPIQSVPSLPSTLPAPFFGPLTATAISELVSTNFQPHYICERSPGIMESWPLDPVALSSLLYGGYIVQASVCICPLVCAGASIFGQKWLVTR